MKVKIKNLPETCGVYIFKDKRGEIIYIGKGLNLKKRIKSYFQKSLLGQKTKKMVGEIKKIKTIKTESEFDALLLEAKLIKKYQPKYNTVARDDKHPLYIKINNEEFPKVLTVRGEDDRKSTFFGPFPRTAIVKSTLKFLRKIFPFCSNKKLAKKPCFYSHINLCTPCPNLINSLLGAEREKLKKAYLLNIKNLKKVLSGKSTSVITTLIKEMKKKARELRFEEAESIKRQVKKLEYLAKPRFSLSEYLKNPNLYEDLRKQELLNLHQCLNSLIPDLRFPRRIEGYDISNIMGKEATGSMAVSIDGEPDKSQYRKFKMKFRKKPDDLSMLKEVLSRRLKHKEWPYPDLIVVDGGKGQVWAGLAVVKKLGLTIPLIGLSKKLEEIVIPQNKGFYSLKLKRNSPALKLLQRLRDEAHRFARRYHLLLRKKSMLYSR